MSQRISERSIAMNSALIHEQGQIAGTRLTVYNLLPQMLDAAWTETAIAQMNGLTPAQVAAARAFVLGHADVVLATHLKIEARMAAGNPPEVIERAKETHETFVQFKDWLAQQQHDADAHPPAHGVRPLPSYREWLADHEARSAAGS